MNTFVVGRCSRNQKVYLRRQSNLHQIGGSPVPLPDLYFDQFILLYILQFLFPIVSCARGIAGEKGWRSGETLSPPINVSWVRFPDPASYVG